MDSRQTRLDQRGALREGNHAGSLPVARQVLSTRNAGSVNMNPISVDFAPPSLVRTLLRMGSLQRLAAASGLALGIWVGFHSHALLDRIEAKDAAIARANSSALAHASAAKSVTTKASISEVQANAVNAAIAQLTIPWRDVLDAIEASTPKEVALLSLEPDARKNILRG